MDEERLLGSYRAELRKIRKHRLNDQPFVSYAQNFEDVILNRLFKGLEKGTYVDVGAYHPVIKSTSYFAYRKGWSGLNVDLSAVNIERFMKIRPRDKNVQAAVGAGRETVRFWLAEGTTRSTKDLQMGQLYEEEFKNGEYVELNTVPLSEILASSGVENIDFLSIDVEGSEAEVLAGTDLKQYSPSVIVIESVHPSNGKPTWPEWEEILFQADYVEIYYDGLNKFYALRGRMGALELPVVPPNFFDNFITFNELIWLCE